MQQGPPQQQPQMMPQQQQQTPGQMQMGQMGGGAMIQGMAGQPAPQMMMQPSNLNYFFFKIFFFIT